MTKKVFGTNEERYQIFEIYDYEGHGEITISNKLFKSFNMIQCIAEEMRDFIDTKIQRNIIKKLNAT